MKSKPSRSDIFILGGGISGICAAIFAAREGATVKLIDSQEDLGGEIGELYQIPMDIPASCNDPFFRELGLFEDICTSLRSENKEGNYSGQARALFSLLYKELNISVMLGHHCIDLTQSSSNDRIESCTILSHAQQFKYLHKAQYFIDCSISGELSKLANTPGEILSSVSPQLAKSNQQFHKSSVLIEIETSNIESTFTCPEWIINKWESNLPEARLALLRSLEKNLPGYHLIEWIGQDVHCPSSSELCWVAWDFIKNRSPFKEIARNLLIKRVIPQPKRGSLFRGTGDYLLTKEDLINGKEFYDSVAVSRAPIIDRNEQVNLAFRKISIPHPFEIPLRSLYSKKIKNLLWAGSHISCDEVVYETLNHPPTLAQIGSAVGYCAAKAISESRLPRTLAKPGHIEQLRQNLLKKNHRTGKSIVPDDNDLSAKGSFTASTTWKNKNLLGLTRKRGKRTKSCLIQFPITSANINAVSLLIEGTENQKFEARLLQGSSHNLSIPGSCLQTDNCILKEVGEQWMTFNFEVEVNKTGWHFLELNSENEFCIVEGQNAPVGHLIQYPQSTCELSVDNPYSEYSVPINYDAHPHDCAIVELSPDQDSYSSNNLKEVNSHPIHFPGLWISQPSDFSYPEFIELNWPYPVVVSKLELFFDPSFGYHTPPTPSHAKVEIANSMIKDYRIYLTLDNGKSILAEEITGNVTAHRIHEFENLRILSLEIEILATHGLNRAQIFRIATYE